MKSFFVFCFLFFTYICTAQQIEITGTVKDSQELPLPAATVYVQKVADSSLVTYTITDKNGFFKLKMPRPKGEVSLFISYTGFKTYKKQLTLEEEIDMEVVHLQQLNNELDQITITTSGAPVVVKSDTLQFNADSFNTKDDAVLEDLLNKLPGVKVDSDGNITVNGKTVNKILVNGEEFFGGDPKIATKNLPKEIIDKIQVVNTKSEKQEFTGEAGDPDNKTINIQVKKDMNKGFFSRLTAAGGTDDRYALNGIANYFDGDFRISLLGGSNNINESGFSSGDLFMHMGGSGRRIVVYGGGGFGSGNGITESTAAGLNLINKWNETTELGGTYLYGHKDNKTRSEVNRENILPNKHYFTNSQSSSNSSTDFHKIDLEFEFQPDTLTRISIRPRIQLNSGANTSNSFSESLDENGVMINNSETSAYANFENNSFSNSLNVLRRLGGNGAYLSFNLRNSHNLTDNKQFFYSEREVFDPSTNTTDTETQDQYIHADQKDNSYDLELTSRSVLAKDFFLDVSYNLNFKNGNNERDVLNFDTNTQDYTDFDATLSNDFEYKSVEHIPNVGLSYEGEKFRGNIDVGLSNLTLQSENKIADVRLKNSYNNLYLNSRLRYRLDRSTSVHVSYRRSTDVPSLEQLQPVTDRTNPLNLVTGNPNLSPEYSQNIRFGFRNYDFATRSGIFFFGSMNFTDDKVVSLSTIDDNLVRHTTYTNVDGNYSINAGGRYSKRIKREARIFRYEFGLWGGSNHNVAFTNGEKYESTSLHASPSIELGYEIEDIFQFSVDYSLDYNKSKYDIFDDREEDFINHSVELDLETYWPKNVVFETEVRYSYDANVGPSYDPTSILWNASLGYQFLDDNAIVELKAYDLLAQNNSVRHSVGNDFVQDSRRLVLDRYFLLSFTYKFTKFGGKEPRRFRRW